MSARLHEGWLVVSYSGGDLSQVHISVGRNRPIIWLPAYLGYVDGARIAKIRPPKEALGREVSVWLRVDGVVRSVGKVAL